MSADIQATIQHVCREVCDLLLTKNKDYGNSFAEPIHVFSSVDARQQLLVRIDDKLKRIQNETLTDHNPHHKEDTVLDLIGYLILLRVLDHEHARATVQC